MSEVAKLFLVLIALACALRWWLAVRQLRYVQAHRDQVPAAFAQTITLEAHRKAADYTCSKTRMEVFRIAYHAALLLLWTVGGMLAWIDQAWRAWQLTEWQTGLLVFASVILISSLLDLPLAVYRTFVIEGRYGFNHTGPGTFLRDLIKEGLLTLLIVLPMVGLVLWLMAPAADTATDTHPSWWLQVWMAWCLFSLLMLWVYPAWIAPWFNRFTPLADGPLRRRITRLAEQAGFDLSGILVMDGSRRSAHGNAYFAGLGAHKRIVLYDTLLARLDDDEVCAVLAHELGHLKRRHIHKQFALMAAFSLTALWLLDGLMVQPWFYQDLAGLRPSHHGALLLFLLGSPVLLAFIAPLLSAASRWQEYQADGYAAEVGAGADLSGALKKLYRDNAATLTPDPLYSAYHDSHPAASARIARLRALSPAEKFG